MDWLGDVVRPRPGAADREAGSADGGVSPGGTRRRDWEVETQDPVQPVAEDGRNLRLRRAGRGRRAFAEDADRERDARGGEDRDGGGPGHDYPPTGGALGVQSGGGGRSPAREEASQGSGGPRRRPTGVDGCIAGAVGLPILGGRL
jgi:hypothetical protein